MDKAHKKLRVWKESIELIKMVYKTTSQMPPVEKFGIISQMKRAVVSVPANIAEGAARKSNKEHLYFYSIARGSLSELDTLLDICKELSLIPKIEIEPLDSQLEKVDALLNGLINYRNSIG